MDTPKLIEEVVVEIAKIEEAVKQQVVEVAEDAKKTSVVDAVLNKFISRKLIVWVLSGVFLYYDKIDGEQWIAISLAYIGIQGVADIANSWKSAGTK